MSSPRTWRTLVPLLLCTGVVLYACTKDTVDPAPAPAGGTTSPVVFDPARLPYDSLSSYRFFVGDLADLSPAEGVMPYDLITPLFSDHAHKNRFVWVPPGSRATLGPDSLPVNFPEGTMVVKAFHYDSVLPTLQRRIVETRVMYRLNGEWNFATYVWNAAQTEAVLDMSGSLTDVDWIDDQGQTRHVTYRIPSHAECFTCHKRDGEPSLLGPKPRNLNRSYAYPDGTMDQFARWESAGILDPAHPPVTTAVTRWDDPSAPLQDRVRAYVDMNCSHCHAATGYCAYRPMRFAWEETADPVNLGVCVAPQDPIAPGVNYIVAKGDPARSMMHFRMGSVQENERMPLLGRTVVHEEGLQLITDWINSLTPTCP